MPFWKENFVHNAIKLIEIDPMLEGMYNSLICFCQNLTKGACENDHLRIIQKTVFNAIISDSLIISTRRSQGTDGR